MRRTPLALLFFGAFVGLIQSCANADSKYEGLSSTSTSEKFGKNMAGPDISELPDSSMLLDAQEENIKKRDVSQGKEPKDKNAEVASSVPNAKNNEREPLITDTSYGRPKEKRHFSSLLKFRNAPFYFAPFTPREEDFTDAEDNEVIKEVAKRFIGSILKSRDIPETFIAYPNKKHFSSLLKARSYSPAYVKRIPESPGADDPLEDYANSLYILSDVNDPSNAVEKRHIGSLGGLRYSFRRNSPYGTYDKRFYASLLKNQNFAPEKRFFDESKYSKGLPVYDSLPVDYSELVEYDVNDIDPERIAQEEDYWANKDKRHFSSIIDKRHISSLMRSRNLYKREISEADYKPEENVANLPHKNGSVRKDRQSTRERVGSEDAANKLSQEYNKNTQSSGKSEETTILPNKDGTQGDQHSLKRHLSSLLQNKLIDKRHVSSLLQNKEPTEKRHFSSLLQNNEPDDKRHFSSLIQNKGADKRFNDDSILDDIENLDKRHYATLLRNKEPLDKKTYLASPLVNAEDMFDKRHFSSLLQNKKSSDKRHLSSLLQNKESSDKRHFSSLLRNVEPLDKRHFSALLKNMDSLDKRHYSSLIQNKLALVKRYFELPYDDADYYDDSIDKRHFSSLLQNQEPTEKRHFSSLLQNVGATERQQFDPLLDNMESGFDKRHFSSLLHNKVGNLEKRAFSSFVDNTEDNADRREYPSLLQDRADTMHKRYFASPLASARSFFGSRASRFSSILKNKNSKRHFSSLLQNPDNVPLKRYFYAGDNYNNGENYSSSFPNGAENGQATNFISLQNDDLDHISSLIQYLNGIDNTKHAPLLQALLYRYLSRNFPNSSDFDIRPASDKRFFRTLLRDEMNVEKRAAPSEDERDTDNILVNDFSQKGIRRLGGSAKYNKRDAEYLDEEIQHVASLGNYRNVEDELNEEKRYLGSLRNYKRDDAEYLDEEKRHLGSLRNSKRSGKDYLSEEKRYLGHLKSRIQTRFGEESPLENFENIRYIGRSDGTLNEEKRHIGSFRNGKRANDDDFDEEKRHISSFRNSKRTYEDEFDEEKRHIGSFRTGKRDYEDEFDKDKRHIGAFRNGKREYEDEFDEEKRHIGAFRNGKREYEDEFDEEKRHIGAFRNGKREYQDEFDGEKRHIGAFRNGKGEYEDEFDEEKRHIGAFRNGKREYEDEFDKDKRHIGAFRNGKHKYEDEFDEEKRHIGSFRNGKRSNEDEFDEGKRHIGSFRSGKRSEKDEFDKEKRHIGSSRNGKRDYEDEYDEEKRHIGSFRNGKRTNENELEEKRHIGSFRNGKRTYDDDIAEGKRHIGSFRGGKRANEDELDEEKRHIGSFRSGKRANKDELDEEKRHIGSFRSGKRENEDELDEEKRHIGSFRSGKRANEDELDEEKRHIGAFRSGKRVNEDELDEEKRHIGSFRSDKRINVDQYDENKRHIGSFRSGKRTNEGDFNAEEGYINSFELGKRENEDNLFEEKRYLGWLKNSKWMNENRFSEGKRLAPDNLEIAFYKGLDGNMSKSSPMNDEVKRKAQADNYESDLMEVRDRALSSRRTNQNTETEESALKRSFSSLLKQQASNTRVKRYIGALAKNNNLPFLSSRSQNYLFGDFYDGPVARPSNIEYFDTYLRDQLRRNAMRKYLLNKASIPMIQLASAGTQTFDNELPEAEADFLDVANTEGDEEEKDASFRQQNSYDNKVDNVRIYNDNGFSRRLSKRFLGSLARRMWFPRPYRSFVEPRSRSQVPAPEPYDISNFGDKMRPSFHAPFPYLQLYRY